MVALFVLQVLSINMMPVAAQEEGTWITGGSQPTYWHFTPRITGAQVYSEYALDPFTFYLPMNDTHIPALIESWDYEPPSGDNYGSLTMHLRRGVLWHDGTEYTTEDIWLADTVGQVLSGLPPNGEVTPNGWISQGAEVTFIDDYTFRHVFRQPISKSYALRLTMGGPGPREPRVMYCRSIWSRFGNSTVKQWLSEVTSDDYPWDENEQPELYALREEYLNFKLRDVTKILGQGPWKYVSVDTGAYVMEKFDDYWMGSDQIKWNKIIIYGGPAPDTMQLMALRHELGWTQWGYGSEMKKLLQASDEFGYMEFPRPWINYGGIYGGRYPISIKEFRQALQIALDLDWAQENAIITGIAFEKPIRWANSPATQVDPYLDEDFISNLDRYDYDVDRANQILDDLGLLDSDNDGFREANGTNIEIECNTFAHSSWMNKLEWVAASWAEIGIKVTPVIQPAYSEFWGSTNDPLVEPPDMYLTWSSNGFDPPETYRWFFANNASQANWGPACWYFPDERAYRKYYEDVVDVPAWVVPEKGAMQDVNITEWTWRVSNPYVSEDDYREGIRIMTWYINEYVPFIQYNINGFQFFVSKLFVDFDRLPPLGDPAWNWYGEVAFPVFMRMGIAVPGLGLGPQPVTMSTVWFLEEVASFVGVDNAIYGPFIAGVSASIPLDNAETLVGEGKASFSAPLPGGLLETVEATFTAVSGTQADVSSLSTVVSDLSDTVSDLNATVSSLSSLLYAVLALQIVALLVIVAVVFMRTGQ
jgi:ABC-type transport system substrate-binding protein